MVLDINVMTGVDDKSIFLTQNQLKRNWELKIQLCIMKINYILKYVQI